MKFVFATAAAAFAALSIGSAAQAATYNLGTLVSGETSTSNTVNHHNTTLSTQVYTDKFTFNISSESAEFSTGAFTEASVPGHTFKITNVDLTLYNAANHVLATTGNFNPITDPNETLSVADLAKGSYYLLAAVTVPKFEKASYTVNATSISAAPEPAAWALMIMGVGLAGGMLRSGRRQVAALA